MFFLGLLLAIKCDQLVLHLLLDSLEPPPSHESFKCRDKRLLWEYLINLKKHVHLPWALIGDFNDIFLPFEQKIVFYSAKTDLFAQCLSNCDLLEMEYVGSKLDRGVCDLHYHMRFLEATIEHLVKRHSNHNPFLFRCY
ncbi:hypothetical protein CR513_61084, partial [Mucuna pruriens]